MTSDVAEEVDFVSDFRDAWRRVQRQLEKNLSAIGLTITELRILKALSVDGPSPMAKFASEFFLTAPSVTGVIDKLEGEGLVERERGSEDRRVVTVRLTPEGRDRLEAGLKLNRQFVTRALKPLSDHEAKQLVELMAKVASGAERD